MQQGGPAVLLQRQEGVGHGSDTLNEPSGHPAPRSLRLMTSGKNSFQQHRIASCCLALFRLRVVCLRKHFFDSLWL